MTDPIPVSLGPLTEVSLQGSLYCVVIGLELSKELARYQAGEITKEACEVAIGQNTDARVARDLAGEDREIRLAVSEELDALRAEAMRLLDQIDPANGPS